MSHLPKLTPGRPSPGEIVIEFFRVFPIPYYHIFIGVSRKNLTFFLVSYDKSWILCDLVGL